MPDAVWLVRPRADGGWDYVSFQCRPALAPAGPSTVEMREGSHLPPQMPLLKHRYQLDPAEAERRRQRLQREGGFRCSKPLF